MATRGKQVEEKSEPPSSFARSQLLLFQSRKKFAFLYCLATVTGLFCLPGVVDALLSTNHEFLVIVLMTLTLPVASLLATVGIYIMNDLVDVDLDKANRKKRPLSSGLVSKKQGWTFVLSTFVAAVLLTMITLRPISMIIMLLMLAIGIAYSAPKIALMKRFVIKTVSIAIFYILCALLGLTSVLNLNLALQNPLLVANVLLTLAIMVFVSSTLNDMGDIGGDKGAGRRTIPIAIGEDNTIKLTMILATAILVETWGFYGAALIISDGNPVTPVTTSVIALIVLMTLRKMRKAIQNPEFVRSQHKKLFPLQLAIHASLIA
jgi:4-hydroxybenzoate polyprenyltransferase